MKHPTQISEEVVSRFINESLRTKTMLEAKKKAKKPKTRDYDYSDEEGAGKRERQEMYGDHQEYEDKEIEEGILDFGKRVLRKVRSTAGRVLDKNYSYEQAKKKANKAEAKKFVGHQDSSSKQQRQTFANRRATYGQLTGDPNTDRSKGITAAGKYLDAIKKRKAEHASQKRLEGDIKKGNSENSSQRYEGELHNEDLKGAAKTVRDKLVRGKRVANVVVQRRLKPWLKKQGDALNQSAKQEADAQMYGNFPSNP